MTRSSASRRARSRTSCAARTRSPITRWRHTECHVNQDSHFTEHRAPRGHPPTTRHGVVSCGMSCKWNSTERRAPRDHACSNNEARAWRRIDWMKLEPYERGASVALIFFLFPARPLSSRSRSARSRPLPWSHRALLARMWVPPGRVAVVGFVGRILRRIWFVRISSSPFSSSFFVLFGRAGGSGGADPARDQRPAQIADQAQDDGRGS